MFLGFASVLAIGQLHARVAGRNTRRRAASHAKSPRPRAASAGWQFTLRELLLFMLAFSSAHGPDRKFSAGDVNAVFQLVRGRNNR